MIQGFLCPAFYLSMIPISAKKFINDIQEGISQLFKQLPEELAHKYQALFDTALKDYATMKQTLKIIDKGALKLRDVARSEQRALDALIKYTQGQGAEGLDNLSRITKGLSPANREVLELNMLNRLFANSLEQLEGLKVFDSQAFFKHLDSLKEGTFQSKAAQDFIEIASGFNKLFNQDAKLAKALKSTTGEQVTSSIATSVSGAAQYQITKALFSIVVRTMPHIPFFKGLNSKVSAAALRHHLKAALNKSASVQDFKIQLNHLVQRQDFDNATKALIREIEGGLPPDDELPKTKLDIEDLAKRQEGESEEQLKARVKKAVMDLSPILGLDNKQERHMWGQKGYITGRSYYEKPFDVEQVKPLFKDGEVLLTQKGDWDKKLIIHHPDFYGMCVPNGDMSKAIKTYKSKVHFGDNSFHLVPYARKGE